MELKEQHISGFPSGDFIKRADNHITDFIKKKLPHASRQNYKQYKDILQQILNSIQPSYTYKTEAVKKIVPSGIYTQRAFLQSSLLPRLFHPDILEKDPSDIYLIFIVSTLGELSLKFEDLSSQIIVDMIASELLEFYTNESDKFTWHVLAEKYLKKITLRFSPGYCDWSLEGQKVIFSAMEGLNLKVKLNDYLIMQPSKSVSAVAFIAGDNLLYQVPCSFCEERCSHRREKFVKKI